MSTNVEGREKAKERKRESVPGTNQPRSQGLSSSRPWGVKRRDTGNGVGDE